MFELISLYASSWSTFGVMFIYIGLCVATCALGSKYGQGCVRYMFYSLIFSPLLVAVFILIGGKSDTQLIKDEIRKRKLKQLVDDIDLDDFDEPFVKEFTERFEKAEREAKERLLKI